MKEVWVVIELHEDCPKIRGVFDDKQKANDAAYGQPNGYWRNVFRVEMNKLL